MIAMMTRGEIGQLTALETAGDVFLLVRVLRDARWLEERDARRVFVERSTGRA